MIVGEEADHGVDLGHEKSDLSEATAQEFFNARYDAREQYVPQYGFCRDFVTNIQVLSPLFALIRLYLTAFMLSIYLKL